MSDNAKAVAIIGMAGRFPGASSVDAFWRNLCAGVESIERFAPTDLEVGASMQAQRLLEFVNARAMIDGAELFDAAFFGIHRSEAELIDPQHRLFLECCWEALEDAGYDPLAYPGAIGVYGGCSINSYFLRNVLQSADEIDRFTTDYPASSSTALLGAGNDFLTTRVAYKLNLRGPAMTIQSACSTSLLSVAQAVQTLLVGQADMMLAGGVSITFPQRRGYLYQSGGMVSQDGRCRTFDAASTGTVFGDGVGVVVLKRLDDAIASRDAIAAVIRGVGVNNDAAQKIGYTAPSIEGQAAAVRAAHSMANFAATSVGYVECHGTATPLGDPIEIAALSQAFEEARGSDARIVIGSVKPNVGHLDIAAGVTGLMKTALALRDGVIPGTLHFESLNPEIDFNGVPFAVERERTAWASSDAPRRAGVSAFGLGGTNVHLALESAPVIERRSIDARPHLLVLSARSEAALASACSRLADHLRGRSDADLPNVAFTLALGRRPFAHRVAIVARTIDEAVRALEDRPKANGGALLADPSVAFMFPGQGAQYPGMGADLAAQLPIFRAAVDRCALLAQPLLHADIREAMWPTENSAESKARLRSTEIAQVALFVIEYALAHVWLSWGVSPAAMVGHSVGEFVAAVLAGVFSLEDAIELVRLRGALMQEQQPGTMLGVALSEEELIPLLPADVDLAAINAPHLCVVAGPTESIDRFDEALRAKTIATRRLHTSHAFHSAMMDPVVQPLAERLSTLNVQAPSIPIVSSVTGDWDALVDSEPADYWSRHCREPVRFSSALTTLVASGVQALLEVGPGNTLCTFARQSAGRASAMPIVPSLPTSEREQLDLASMLASAGKLWMAGVAIDLSAMFDDASYERISLPTYPFERQRYWRERVSSLEDTTEKSMSEERNERAPVSDPGTGVDTVIRDVIALFEELSGERLAHSDSRATFLDLGFDSLFLGRVAQQIVRRFGVAVTFRELLSAFPSIDALSRHLIEMAPALASPAPTGTSAVPAVVAPVQEPTALGHSPFERVMHEQLTVMQTLMREQLEALGRMRTTIPIVPRAEVPSPTIAPSLDEQRPPDGASRYDAFAIVRSDVRSDITHVQMEHIASLVAATVARTPRSKERTARMRPVLADPRVAAGYRREWKEMVYPITMSRALGSRLWDVDGNEYIDLLNGFGQTAFGHSPAFVIDAVNAQLRDGFAIGPQAELAGDVAERFCRLTGNERMTFCNTGSEAVMAAMRVARTVSGRSRIVVFEGAYHGQFDEVLVKRGRNSSQALPIAAGIPMESVSNMTVLEYGTDASLDWIAEHAEDIAAVIVEPVQSRHPDFVPRDFLVALREMTRNAEIALVFDEVVTGFRVHAGGMQAVLGIRADLATYGKVVGGGLPIGVLAGTAKYMDALDGGTWNYGDDSGPEVAPTFFAGTFVRHPLALASMDAVLRHIETSGAPLQQQLSAMTERLVKRLNDLFASRGIATRIERYGSIFYVNFNREERLSGLLYYHLRNHGVYLQEGFPCFLTTAHTDADIEAIVSAFEESLAALQSADIFGRAPQSREIVLHDLTLTDPQKEIWLAAQLSDEASCAFNESVLIRMSGELDRSALKAAWQGVISRHESLRAAFSATGESMRISSDRSIEIADVDDWETSLFDAIERDARMPFDLVSGPLVRATLFSLAPAEHALILTAHHIVCDGWSMNIIIDELKVQYGAIVQGKYPGLPLPLAFSEYAQRLNRASQSDAPVESYWLEVFREPVLNLELPTDRPRPATKSFRGGTRTARIDSSVERTIRALGARHGCTLFVTLLAGFQTLMGRLSGQRDIVVAVPAAGQAAIDEDVLVGHCVNLLPIRTRWQPQTRVAELLLDLKGTILDAYDHQSTTLGTIVQALDLKRGFDRVPLADVQFNLERLGDSEHIAGVKFGVEPNPKAFVNFDLFLNVVESIDGLRLDCDYNADIFDAATIDRWLASYSTVLNAFAANDQQPVSAVPYFSPADQALLALMNETSAEYAQDACIHTLFEQQAALRPGAIAVRCGDAALTYEQLDARANQLAHFLLKRTGTRKLVGVLLDRSIDMVVALLATLKAGCAYVPLDPMHPHARLRRILQEAEVAAVIIDEGKRSDLIADSRKIVDLVRDARTIAEEPTSMPPAVVVSDDLAYVISTSGSTGAPKGVEIPHRNVVNFLGSMAKKPGLTERDVVLAVTTIAFDIAALEIFLPLSVGASVLIASREAASDGFRLLELLGEATVMQATPPTWRLLLEAGFGGSKALKMLCGGEALPRELADRLLVGGGELWNMYGPTETTIWSSCVRVLSDANPISVGTPIANTRMYVLDADDRLVAPGIVGHLHIAGDGVARGYLHQRELTDERFVRDPYGPGRMYRTGDLARILPNGEVQVVGRSDQQVKLRGYRIELGEIEALLEARGRLAAAAVLLQNDDAGHGELIAFYVVRPEYPHTPASLRNALAPELPPYMIPSVWLALPALPLSPSGKVDRAALAALRSAAAASLIEPMDATLDLTPTEEALAKIWADVLGTEHFTGTENLFELGADSIQLFAITARANAAGLQLSAKEVFRYPTISALARRLDERSSSDRSKSAYG